MALSAPEVSRLELLSTTRLRTYVRMVRTYPLVHIGRRNYVESECSLSAPKPKSECSNDQTLLAMEE